MMTVDRTQAFNLAGPIAGRMEIRDIRNRIVHAELKDEYDSSCQLTYDMEQETSFLAGRGFLVISNEYRVSIQQVGTTLVSADEGGEPTGPAEVALLKLVLEGVFEIHSEEGDIEPTQEQYRAYAESTGSLALYPYLRLQVSTLTTGLGLPTLLLGVQRITFDGVKVPAERSDSPLDLEQSPEK